MRTVGPSCKLLKAQPAIRVPPRGFTLLEVMVAMAVLGIAMLALLALHHQSLRSVIQAQEVTRAAMLAQAVIAQAELERFPKLGTTQGDFSTLFPKEYPNLRWQRVVEASGSFPDVRKVQVVVMYGPSLSRHFTLTEFLHSPVPIVPVPAQNGDDQQDEDSPDE
jgi:general secretion pathway protein I